MPRTSQPSKRSIAPRVPPLLDVLQRLAYDLQDGLDAGFAALAAVGPPPRRPSRIKPKREPGYMEREVLLERGYERLNRFVCYHPLCVLIEIIEAREPGISFTLGDFVNKDLRTGSKPVPVTPSRLIDLLQPSPEYRPRVEQELRRIGEFDATGETADILARFEAECPGELRRLGFAVGEDDADPDANQPNHTKTSSSRRHRMTVEQANEKAMELAAKEG